MGAVLYDYCGSLYVNMTNRCPSRCVFCVRDAKEGLGTAGSLWLEREPTVDEMHREFHRWRMDRYGEVVFCGYGEPTERFDDIVKVAKHVRAKYGCRTRLNTNGLGDLINGRSIAGEVAEAFDSVSISLNAPDADTYDGICPSRFGSKSYPAILRFVESCIGRMRDVTVSVVSGTISGSQEYECERMAQKWGVGFRSR